MGGRNASSREGERERKKERDPSRSLEVAVSISARRQTEARICHNTTQELSSAISCSERKKERNPLSEVPLMGASESRLLQQTIRARRGRRGGVKNVGWYASFKSNLSNFLSNPEAFFSWMISFFGVWGGFELL